MLRLCLEVRSTVVGSALCVMSDSIAFTMCSGILELLMTPLLMILELALCSLPMGRRVRIVAGNSCRLVVS